MAAGHTGLVARSDLVPVVAGFGAARAARVVHSVVFTLSGHTSGVRLPQDWHSLPLTGSAVGDEGLAVAVFMDRTLTHVRHTRPVERCEVHHTVTLLKLPRLYLLALPVRPELHFDAARTQEGRRPARRMLLRANLISLDSPRLCKLIHVELELTITSHCVVTLVTVVVAAKAAETST